MFVGHYKWALDQLFNKHNFDRVIILEGENYLVFGYLSSLLLCCWWDLWYSVLNIDFCGIQMIWKLPLISLTILRPQPPSLIMTSESFLYDVMAFAAFHHLKF